MVETIVQSVLVRFVLWYVMIVVIVARPLTIKIEKRQSGNGQMADVQLNEADLKQNGEQLPEAEQEDKKFFSSNGIDLWDGGIIPYTFENFDSDDKKKAKKAMEIWSQHTCITFHKMTKEELKNPRTLDYVKIRYENITNSYVGTKDRDYKTKGQNLNIRRDHAAKMQIYLHELGHVIGFHHEHSRLDRDQYVKINSENILDEMRHNFIKLNYVKNTPYDFSSIMHYGLYNSAANKNIKTIEVRNPDELDIDIDNIGTRRRLSKHDIAWANKLYNCEATTKPTASPPPKFYRQFKVELPRIPEKVADSGYSSKSYLKCSNESCDVQGTTKVPLFITKLDTSTNGLRVGDEVLLSSHRSSVRHGEWILCDLDNCYSSKACVVSSHNASSGKVNFAFSRSGCKDHVLKISSKFLKQNETVVNSSRIVLEFSSPRNTREWIGCDSSNYCKRTECKRPNVTILGHTSSTNCDSQMDEFEAVFVS